MRILRKILNIVRVQRKKRMIKRYRLAEDNCGEYIKYSDHITEIKRIMKIKGVELCVKCNKNEKCILYNRFGVIAVKCNKYEKIKNVVRNRKKKL